jgi:type IV secretory pathway VirB10-like protein
MLREARACPKCVILKILCKHKKMTDIPSKQTACDTCIKLHIKCVHMPTPSAASGASGTPAKAAAKAAESPAAAKPAKAAAKPAKAAAKPAKAAAKPAPVATKRAQEHVPVPSTVFQTKRAEQTVPIECNDVDAEMEQELAINREGLRALLGPVPSGEPAPVAAPVVDEGAALSVEEVAMGFWASTAEDGFWLPDSGFLDFWTTVLTAEEEEAANDLRVSGEQEPAFTEEEEEAARDFCSDLR